MTFSQPTLAGALARERVEDLRRKAETARTGAAVRRRHRTPRRRRTWWTYVTARTPSTA